MTDEDFPPTPGGVRLRRAIAAAGAVVRYTRFELDPGPGRAEGAALDLDVLLAAYAGDRLGPVDWLPA
jgi:hypothetical protein